MSAVGAVPEEATHCSRQENLWEAIRQYAYHVRKWDFPLDDEEQQKNMPTLPDASQPREMDK